MEVAAVPLNQEELSLLAACPLFQKVEGGWLRSLAELEGDYKVCPGHGALSTLEHERRTNPCVRQATGR